MRDTYSRYTVRPLFSMLFRLRSDPRCSLLRAPRPPRPPPLSQTLTSDPPLHPDPLQTPTYDRYTPWCSGDNPALDSRSWPRLCTIESIQQVLHAFVGTPRDGARRAHLQHPRL